MRIQLFGVLKELAATEWITLSGCTTSETLKEAIHALYPVFATQSYAMAVNRKIVLADTVLNEEDEIALLPPFSGG